MSVAKINAIYFALESQNYKEAQKLCEKLLQKTTNPNILLETLHATTLSRQNNPLGIIKAVEILASRPECLNSTHTSIPTCLMNIFLDAQQYGIQMQYVKQIVAANPRNTEYLFSLTTALLRCAIWRTVQYNALFTQSQNDWVYSNETNDLEWNHREQEKKVVLEAWMGFQQAVIQWNNTSHVPLAPNWIVFSLLMQHYLREQKRSTTNMSTVANSETKIHSVYLKLAHRFLDKIPITSNTKQQYECNKGKTERLIFYNLRLHLTVQALMGNWDSCRELINSIDYNSPFVTSQEQLITTRIYIELQSHQWTNALIIFKSIFYKNPNILLIYHFIGFLFTCIYHLPKHKINETELLVLEDALSFFFNWVSGEDIIDPDTLPDIYNRIIPKTLLQYLGLLELLRRCKQFQKNQTLDESLIINNNWEIIENVVSTSQVVNRQKGLSTLCKLIHDNLLCYYILQFIKHWGTLSSCFSCIRYPLSMLDSDDLIKCYNELSQLKSILFSNDHWDTAQVTYLITIERGLAAILPTLLSYHITSDNQWPDYFTPESVALYGTEMIELINRFSCSQILKSETKDLNNMIGDLPLFVVHRLLLLQQYQQCLNKTCIQLSHTQTLSYDSAVNCCLRILLNTFNQSSPNPAMHFVLLLLYKANGNEQAALKEWDRLHMRYLQYQSLGYILRDSLIHAIHFSDALDLCHKQLDAIHEFEQTSLVNNLSTVLKQHYINDVVSTISSLQNIRMSFNFATTVIQHAFLQLLCQPYKTFMEFNMSLSTLIYDLNHVMTNTIVNQDEQTQSLLNPTFIFESTQLLTALTYSSAGEISKQFIYSHNTDDLLETPIPNHMQYDLRQDLTIDTQVYMTSFSLPYHPVSSMLSCWNPSSIHHQLSTSELRLMETSLFVGVPHMNMDSQTPTPLLLNVSSMITGLPSLIDDSFQSIGYNYSRLSLLLCLFKAIQDHNTPWCIALSQLSFNPLPYSVNDYGKNPNLQSIEKTQWTYIVSFSGLIAQLLTSSTTLFESKNNIIQCQNDIILAMLRLLNDVTEPCLQYQESTSSFTQSANWSFLYHMYYSIEFILLCIVFTASMIQSYKKIKISSHPKLQSQCLSDLHLNKMTVKQWIIGCISRLHHIIRHIHYLIKQNSKLQLNQPLTYHESDPLIKNEQMSSITNTLFLMADTISILPQTNERAESTNHFSSWKSSLTQIHEVLTKFLQLFETI